MFMVKELHALFVQYVQIQELMIVKRINVCRYCYREKIKEEEVRYSNSEADVSGNEPYMS